MYGVLERQFHNYYEEATGLHGRTGDKLLQILESRLDNVVYWVSFAKSRDMARQLVTHGHLTVNGRKVDIPSYRVAENDIVEVRQKSRDMTPFVVAQAEAGERQVPAWLEVVPNQSVCSCTRCRSVRRSTRRCRNSSLLSFTRSNLIRLRPPAGPSGGRAEPVAQRARPPRS